MNQPLRVLRFDGIHADTLGHYFCGAGLLTAVSQRWRDMRGCWRDRRFLLVHPTLTTEEIHRFILEEWQPTKYERWWDKEQKADTKGKESVQIRRARNSRSIGEVEVLEAHLVGAARNQFNPVFANGGTLGRRDFPKVHSSGLELIGIARTGKSMDVKLPSYFAGFCKQFLKRSEKTRKQQAGEWLESTLMGNDITELPPLRSAGTWFLFCNEAANSGQSWTREDTRLSPWSFLLAVEGALLLVGDVNRRLSTRARPYAVFPFVCDPAQPLAPGEVGMSKGEFWAPLWDYPATLTEVRQLFKRGLARIGNRSAQAPHEFAISAMAAGTDSGVSEFARFDLRQTTSAKVYEAVPRERIRVSVAGRLADASRLAASGLLSCLIPWLNRLPYEPRDSKQRGKFRGLRGPIEAAIIRVSDNVQDPQRWRRLLLMLSDTQSRIDRNKTFREKLAALPWLNPAWFDRAWPTQEQSDEITLAKAISSVGATTEYPLLLNTFGVEIQKRRLAFTKGDRPPRVVWNEGRAARVLAELLQRRLIDAAKLAVRVDGSLNFRFLTGTHLAPQRSIARMVCGDIDLELMARWVPAFSLIDWGREKPQAIMDSAVLTGETLLLALFRPIFHPNPKAVLGWLSPTADCEPKPALARRISNSILTGDLDAAVELAKSFYRALGRSVVDLPRHDLRDADMLIRLAAALLIPMSDNDIRRSFYRWLIPLKHETSARRFQWPKMKETTHSGKETSSSIPTDRIA